MKILYINLQKILKEKKKNKKNMIFLILNLQAMSQKKNIRIDRSL